MTVPFLPLAAQVANLAERKRNLSPSDLEPSRDKKYVYRYPEDLGQGALKNYTVFYINVRNKGLTTAQRWSEVVDVPADRTRERRIRTEDKTVQASTGAQVTIASMGAGANVGKSVGGDGASGLVGAAVGAGIVAGIELTTGGAIQKTVLGGQTAEDLQVVQLKHVVALPLMTRPSATYKAGWVDMDTGIAGGMMQAGTAAAFMDGLKDIGSEITKGGEGNVTAVFQKAMDNPAFQGPMASLLYKKLISADMFGTGAGEVIEKATARTPNPFREQLFRTMGFRTFSFSYTFNPKSRKEAMDIRAIITLLKYHMHPGLTSLNFFLTYPAEFNIKYFYNGKESKFLHKISTCALTDLAVDYGSDNDFIVFSPDESGTQYGIPTEISLKLEFTELELLSKERMDQGF
jgi:hypothetical protein